MITSILRLDVGGQVFATTLGTLTRDPSSKLAKLAYDKWLSTSSTAAVQSSSSMIVASTSSAPTIFIDRDPSHFRYILNYLRDGDSAVLPSSTASCSQSAPVLNELLREAEFYELKSLQQKLCAILGGHHCGSSNPTSTYLGGSNNSQSKDTVGRIRHADSDSPRSRRVSSSATSSVANWTPKNGDLVKWTDDGFERFWSALMDKITHRGYVDWLFCHHCDNDYEVRLPELPDVLYGWQNVKTFLSDMNGKLDAYVNEKCVYVNWKNVYCGKDGYLDSVRFVMHVPVVWLKPFVLSTS